MPVATRGRRDDAERHRQLGGMVRLDASASVCDVVGCDEAATATYLDTRDSQVLEFSICPVHFFRLRKGPQPVIVAERFGLSDVDGRPVLLLD